MTSLTMQTPKRPLKELIEKASVATVPPPADRGKYAHLVAVVQTLRSGGFSLSDAVHWLVHEGEITQEQYHSAYSSFRAALIRRKAREQKTKTTP